MVSHRLAHGTTALARLGRLVPAWFVLAFVCALLGYLLVWQRGFYADDYGLKPKAIALSADHPGPVVSPEHDRFIARTLALQLARMIPDHELLVRAIAAGVASAVALLLGWLIYRSFGSPLMAVVAGWVALMPLIGHQAVLWLKAYETSEETLFGLIFLHAGYSALRGPHPARFTLVTLVAFGVACLCGEQVISALVFVPLLAIVLAARGKVSMRAAAWRTLSIVVPALVFLAGLYVAVYADFSHVTIRGGLASGISDVAAQVRNALGATGGLVARPGLRLLRDMLVIGVHEVVSSLLAAFLLILAIVLLVWTAVTWECDGSRRPRFLSGAVALICGSFWFLMALFLPAILIRGQAFPSRLFYIPSMGLAVAVAGLALLVAQALGPRVGERLVLICAGAFLVVSSLVMLGDARAYAARYQLDEQQASTLVAALPPSAVQAGWYIIPLRMDERLFGRYDAISNRLQGIFLGQRTLPTLHRLYNGRDLQTVGSDNSARRRVEYTPANGQSPALLLMNDTPLPVAETLFFVYENGASQIVGRLTLTATDGSLQTIDFPLAAKLRAAGVHTISYSIAIK